MKMISRTLGFFAVLGLTSCATSTTTVLKAGTAKPKDCELQIFTEASKISGKYEELCLVDAKTSLFIFGDKSLKALLDQSRPAVCKCGGDAVVVVDKGSSQFGLSSRGTVLLKAIRFVK